MNYHNTLILDLLKTNIHGVITSSIIATILIFFMLRQYTPYSVVLVWVFLQFTLGAIRLSVGLRLKELIKKHPDSSDIQKYLKLYVAIIVGIAFSLGIVPWIAVIYDAPTVYIFLIGMWLIMLASGSVATFGAVYIAFFGYMVFMMGPFILLAIYMGGTVYHLLGGTIVVYFTILASSGYGFHLTLKRSIDADKKYQTLFQKSQDGIAIIDDHNFKEMNISLAKMFGYSLDEFKTINIFDLLPEYQPNGEHSIRRMLRAAKNSHNQPVTLEWLYLKKDMNYLWAEVTLSEISVNDEKVIYAVWRDIGNRKIMEGEINLSNYALKEKIEEEVSKNRYKDQQIIQQSKLAQMGEMISMIAHQWRQPLAAIAATSVSIHLRANLNKLDNKTAIELSQNIAEYSKHLSATIDDFRDFFKSNKAKEKTTFTKLVTSVLEIVEGSIIHKNITLSTDLNSELVFYIHANELKQVILNLIKNAEDAIVENKIENAKITIETFDNVLIVSDNAGGVPLEIQEKIFNPYFSTKKQKEGTGLGLYMSKTIISDHCNGSLTLKNSEDGAVFKIELPIDENTTQPKGEKDEVS